MTRSHCGSSSGPTGFDGREILSLTRRTAQTNTAEGNMRLFCYRTARQAMRQEQKAQNTEQELYNLVRTMKMECG